MAKQQKLPGASSVTMPSFAKTLRDARMDRGLSQSDLARMIWGDTEDSRGYKVARNRDRISYYEAGKAEPEPQTLKALADALKMKVEDLAPQMVANEMSSQEPEMQMTMVPDRSDMVHLKVNTLCTLSLAAKIIAQLSAARDARGANT